MSTVHIKSTTTPASSTQNSASNTRWDHSGYDQLQQEENSGEWHHVQRPQKKKPAKPEKKQSGGSRKERGGRKNGNQKETGPVGSVLSDEKGSDSLKFEDHHKSKKEKRPDRLLYNPRRNRPQGDENDKVARKETVPKLGLSKDLTGLIETPTKIQMNDQENEKNSPSNVSTAMSDRQKNFEEENRDEAAAVASVVENSQDDALLDSNLLFTMCFETEGGLEMIPIYKDEQDYEEFLNELCGSHNLTSELEALHFKINLLRVIKEMHPEPSRLEECLDKLLDRNYQLLTSQFNDDHDEDDSNETGYYDFPGIDWSRNSYINACSSSQSFNITQA